jgi:hypothetical protein
MKYKNWQDPVYKSDIHFWCDCTIEEFDKYLIKKFPFLKPETYGPFDALSVQVISPQGYAHYAVWVNKRKNFYAMVHEAVHTWQKISKDRGIERGHEAEAYFIEYLVQQMWRVMSKK